MHFCLPGSKNHYLHTTPIAPSTMPPKSSAAKEKDLAAEDEVLQAVILADSFNKRFRPLTVGKPRVRSIHQVLCGEELIVVVYHSACCPSAMQHFLTGRSRV